MRLPSPSTRTRPRLEAGEGLSGDGEAGREHSPAKEPPRLVLRAPGHRPPEGIQEKRGAWALMPSQEPNPRELVGEGAVARE